MDRREATDAFFEECTAIDRLQLMDSFVRTPGNFAFWAEEAARASQAAKGAKANREFVWAKTYLVKSATAEVTGKKMTVDALKATVEVDDDYQASVQAEIAAEAKYESLRYKTEALRIHRDCLVQCGSMTRQEMQTDPLVRRTT